MKKLFYNIFVSILVVLFNAFVGGLFLFLADKTTMAHNVLAFFNVSGLSYLQYCLGTFMLNLVLDALKPIKFGSVLTRTSEITSEIFGKTE